MAGMFLPSLQPHQTGLTLSFQGGSLFPSPLLLGCSLTLPFLEAAAYIRH